MYYNFKHTYGALKYLAHLHSLKLYILLTFFLFMRIRSLPKYGLKESTFCQKKAWILALSINLNYRARAKILYLVIHLNRSLPEISCLQSGSQPCRFPSINQHRVTFSFLRYFHEKSIITIYNFYHLII